MRTYQNQLYIAPSTQEVEDECAKQKLSRYALDLVQDFAAAFAEEVPRGQTDLEAEIEGVARALIFTPTSSGRYLLSNEYYDTLVEIQRAWTAEQLAKAAVQLGVISVILRDTGLIQKVRGGSPLLKAVYLLVLISEDLRLGDERQDGNSPVYGFPIFTKAGMPTPRLTDPIIEKIEAKMKVVNRLEPTDAEMLPREKGEELSPFFLMDDRLECMFRVEQILRDSPEVKVTRKATYRKDSAGEEKRSRVALGLHDLGRTGRRSLLKRGLLAHSLINGTERCVQPYTREDKLPLLVCLIDKSGSMSGDNKVAKAHGILYHLIKQVKAGKCRGLFSWFETRCYGFYYLSPDQDLLKWFREDVLPTRYNAGVTDISAVLLEALGKIEVVGVENDLSIDPTQKHVFLINDGEDNAGGLKLADLRSATLHGFILNSTNPDIRKLCKESGGLYMEEI
jgi:hypothetical protein